MRLPDTTSTKITDLKTLVTAGSLTVAFLSLLLAYGERPLKEALVTFDPSEIRVGIINENDLPADQLEIYIQNMGSAKAEKVKFAIYEIPFKDSIVSENGDRVVALYDEKIMGDLLPGQTTPIAGVLLFHDGISSLDGSVHSLVREQIALVFEIEYVDSLTTNKKSNFVFLQHTVGGKKPLMLLEKDFKKVEERLLAYLDEHSKHNFYDYLIAQSSLEGGKISMSYLEKIGMAFSDTTNSLMCIYLPPTSNLPSFPRVSKLLK